MAINAGIAIVGKARFDYTCEVCGTPIQKGERYVSDRVYVADPTYGKRGYRAKNKRCLPCAMKDPAIRDETAGMISVIYQMVQEQAKRK